MALVDAILHNRIKESPHLQDENIRAMLLVLGVAALATAGIGK
jgi:hypothetical protein